MKLNVKGFTDEQLKNCVDLINKIENMYESEISEALYDYITENENVFDKIEAEVIRLLPWAIDEYGITTDDNEETCLYNCDALYMKAICNVVGDKVIAVECGYGTIKLINE
jgi:hypothetical protein